MEDVDFRNLQERTQLIEDLTATPGWALLIDRARATMIQKQQRLINGRAENYEEYRAECAYMDGMQFVMSLPERTRNELEAELALRREVKQQEEQLGEDS